MLLPFCDSPFDIKIERTVSLFQKFTSERPLFIFVIFAIGHQKQLRLRTNAVLILHTLLTDIENHIAYFILMKRLLYLVLLPITIIGCSEEVKIDSALLAAFEKAKEIIAGVRTVRLQKNIPNKEPLTLQAVGSHDNRCDAIITKLGNLSAIETVTAKDATAVSFMVGTTEYAVPLGNNIDVEAEIKKLEEELNYQQGFLRSVLAKLGNERFVNNAPAKVVEMERKKQADAESKIKSLEESIAALKK